jgi:primosomal protein N' (replication factor Y)
MDIDTVRGKNAHDVLIQQFEQQRIDILVGHANGSKRFGF